MPNYVPVMFNGVPQLNFNGNPMKKESGQTLDPECCCLTLPGCCEGLPLTLHATTVVTGCTEPHGCAGTYEYTITWSAALCGYTGSFSCGGQTWIFVMWYRDCDEPLHAEHCINRGTVFGVFCFAGRFYCNEIEDDHALNGCALMDGSENDAGCHLANFTFGTAVGDLDAICCDIGDQETTVTL